MLHLRHVCIMGRLKLGLLQNLVPTPNTIGSLSNVVGILLESAASELLAFCLLTEDGNPIQPEG